MVVRLITLTYWQKAIVVGIIGGIGFFLYYKLGQRPPYYITPMNPLGVLLFFLAIGAIGAAIAAGDWKNIKNLAISGAIVGSTTGAISAITVAILNNIYFIGLSGMLHDWPYYLIFGGYFTVIIATITLIIGAFGGTLFSLIVQLPGMVRHFR